MKRDDSPVFLPQDATSDGWDTFYVPRFHVTDFSVMRPRDEM